MADSTDYRRWKERAKEDISMLESVYKDGLDRAGNSFCYMAHQAIEKLLKAFLLKNGESIIRTHDLLFLLKKCLKYNNSLLTLKEEITILNEYFVSARYPDDIEIGRTLKEAEEAYVYVQTIKEHLDPLLY